MAFTQNYTLVTIIKTYLFPPLRPLTLSHSLSKLLYFSYFLPVASTPPSSLSLALPAILDRQFSGILCLYKIYLRCLIRRNTAKHLLRTAIPLLRYKIVVIKSIYKNNKTL